MGLMTPARPWRLISPAVIKMILARTAALRKVVQGSNDHREDRVTHARLIVIGQVLRSIDAVALTSLAAIIAAQKIKLRLKRTYKPL